MSRFRALLFMAGGFVVGSAAAAVWLTDRTPAVEVFEEGMHIYKESFVTEGEWHHVATVHGWDDDLEVCRDLAGYLEQSGSSRYVCRPIVD